MNTIRIELEGILTRCAELADMLRSNRKKDRKYAAKALYERVLPNLDVLNIDDPDMLHEIYCFEVEYRNKIVHGNYLQAQEQAIKFRQTVRKEFQPKEAYSELS